MTNYKEWKTPESLVVLEGWARDGLLEKDMAGKIGISPQTFSEWKKKHPEFLEAVKKGKEVIDYVVENALLNRALGHEKKVIKVHKIKTVKMDKGKRLETEELVEKEEVVYYPPDVTAQIFWLKNRKPAQWRDKPPEVVDVKLSFNPLEKMTEEQLLRLANMDIKAEEMEDKDGR